MVITTNFQTILDQLPLLSDIEKKSYLAIFNRLPDELKNEFAEIFSSSVQKQQQAVENYEKRIAAAVSKYEERIEDVAKQADKSFTDN